MRAVGDAAGPGRRPVHDVPDGPGQALRAAPVQVGGAADRVRAGHPQVQPDQPRRVRPGRIHQAAHLRIGAGQRDHQSVRSGGVQGDLEGRRVRRRDHPPGDPERRELPPGQLPEQPEIRDEPGGGEHGNSRHDVADLRIVTSVIASPRPASARPRGGLIVSPRPASARPRGGLIASRASAWGRPPPRSETRPDRR
ncbi:hypothetical protein ACFSTC_39305 [Nonomuraea ferruginea]